MLKKVLLIAGSVFSGLNFGIISCVSPIYLLISFAIGGDGITTSVSTFAIFALVSAIIAFTVMYVYGYKKRREHEQMSVYVACFGWSIVAGALIAAAALFIYAAGEMYRIG